MVKLIANSRICVGAFQYDIRGRFAGAGNLRLCSWAYSVLKISLPEQTIGFAFNLDRIRASPEATPGEHC